MMKSAHFFAGIGGAALGFERAGIQPVLMCEIDEACRRVLRKHWPDAQYHADVSTITEAEIHERIDVVTGGFPCQDISHARTGSGLGLGAGLEGERSGLWFEQLRFIEKHQPSYVVGENVTALRGRGLERLLASLDKIGYDAEWHCISAAYLGAPHHRDRIWIIAYPRSKGFQRPLLERGAISFAARSQSAQLGDIAVSCGDLWIESSRHIRMGDGLPDQPHRFKQLGNSCAPIITEVIGNAIVEAELLS